MNINELSHAMKGVIKGSVLGGGSTSETLAYGFVQGDLIPFWISKWSTYCAGKIA